MIYIGNPLTAHDPDRLLDLARTAHLRGAELLERGEGGRSLVWRRRCARLLRMRREAIRHA